MLYQGKDWYNKNALQNLNIIYLHKFLFLYRCMLFAYIHMYEYRHTQTPIFLFPYKLLLPIDRKKREKPFIRG